MTNEDKFTSRKFILAFLVVVVISVLTFMGTMTVADYTDMLKWVLGIYTVGNVGTSLVSKLKK